GTPTGGGQQGRYDREHHSLVASSVSLTSLHHGHRLASSRRLARPIPATGRGRPSGSAEIRRERRSVLLLHARMGARWCAALPWPPHMRAAPRSGTPPTLRT